MNTVPVSLLAGTFRQVVENSSDYVCLIDGAGKILFVNRSPAGYPSVEELAGTSLFDWIAPALAEPYRQALALVFEEGRQASHDISTLAPDGAETWWQTRAGPVRDDDGRIVAASIIGSDVTESKRARVEHSLRESEEFLRMSQQAGHSGSWEWDPRDNRVKWSDEMCRIHGISQEQFGRTLDASLRFVHPEDVKIIQDGMRVVFEQDRFAPAEYRIVRPDGEQRFVYGRGAIQRDTQGNITKLIGTVTDVTDHKHMTLALRQSEERFRILVDYAPEAIVVCDADAGRFVDANAKACQLFGMERAELLRVGPVELSPPRQPNGTSSAELARLRIGEALAGGTPQFEWVHLDTHGREIVCEIFLVRLPSQTGNLIRGSMVDITARKRAQAEQARLATIIEATSDLVGTADDQGHALYLNRAMRERLEIPDAEDITRSTIADYHPEADTRRILEEALPRARRDGRWEGETTLRARSGRLIPVSQVVLAHKDPDGAVRYYSTVARDVSERKLIEKALQDSAQQLRHFNVELEARVRERTAQLEAANRELEAFSYSVSHDLRAPLRAIAGFCSLLVRDHLPALQGEAAHFLKRVAANAEQMGQLVDDLLSFARLNRQALNKSPVEPAELVHQVLAEQESAVKGRSVRIEVGNLPACLADPALLKLVFANLIDNALKYSRPRAPAVIEIGCEPANDGNAPVYFVKDNGVGFNMKYVGKLFGVFQRLHRAEDFEGTGVGLAIVQRIVRRHGGRVWADAALERGAIFFFTLEGEDPYSHGDAHD